MSEENAEEPDEEEKPLDQSQEEDEGETEGPIEEEKPKLRMIDWIKSEPVRKTDGIEVKDEYMDNSYWSSPPIMSLDDILAESDYI